jgi:hypothetical protein
MTREPKEGGRFNIAILHEYHWITGGAFPGALSENQIIPTSHPDLKKRFMGFDVVIFGDNHIPWGTRTKDITLWNCGGFMRRKSDDNFQPRVGLVHADGTITPHYLDTAKDVFVPVSKEEEAKANPNLDEFLVELRKLNATALDYKGALERAMTKLGTQAQQLLTEALEHGQH